jgi:transglutaminase-like putative cysteine protease
MDMKEALKVVPQERRCVDIQECLLPTDVIDSDHPLVKETAEKVVRRAKAPVEIARRIFYFVRDDIKYNFAPLLRSREDWKASSTLERGDGFCQQKAVLFAALLRAAGVPSQVAFQHIKDYKLLGTRYEPYMPDGVLPFHGLTVVYLNGRWLWEDATLDSGLCNRRGYRLVEFSAEGEALLPATDLQGHPHFEFLGDFGPYPDLPKEISDAFIDPVGWEMWQALVKRTHLTM